jgi:hypothetical protein
MKKLARAGGFPRVLAVILILFQGSGAWAASAITTTATTLAPTVVVSPTPTASTAAQTSCDSLCSNSTVSASNPSLQQNTQCAAYNTAGSSKTMDYVVLGLEGVALGTCVTACAGQASILGASSQALCTDSNTVAQGAQIVSALMVKDQSAASKLMGALSGAAGIGISAFEGGGMSGVWSTKFGDTKPADLKQKQACMTSVFLGLSMAQRIMAINSENSTQNQACNAVQALNSQNGIINSTGGVSGGSSSTASSNAILSNGVQAGLTCVAGNGLASCASGTPAAAAMDTGALIKSGADQQLASAAQGITPGLVSAVQGGASAGSVVGGAASAGGAGFGDAMKTLADAAGEISGESGEGEVGLALGTTTGGGGGAGHRASNDDSSGDIGSLLAGVFGKQAGAGGAQPAVRSLAFAQDTSSDIYHTGYKGTIFDIVSQKTASVKNRVESLDFASPSNRVMNGMSAFGH